jgi:hypothetical protein
MNIFNNANGWADGSGAGGYNLAAGGANGANPEQRHQLVIDGNAGDVVNSSGWGTSVGTVTHSGQTYDVYNQGLYAQLLIDQRITQMQAEGVTFKTSHYIGEAAQAPSKDLTVKTPADLQNPHHPPFSRRQLLSQTRHPCLRHPAEQPSQRHQESASLVPRRQGFHA